MSAILRKMKHKIMDIIMKIIYEKIKSTVLRSFNYLNIDLIFLMCSLACSKEETVFRVMFEGGKCVQSPAALNSAHSSSLTKFHFWINIFWWFFTKKRTVAPETTGLRVNSKLWSVLQSLCTRAHGHKDLDVLHLNFTIFFT